MRAYVFTDEVLAGQAGRFVWLEIDTEKAKNAPVRRKLPIPALPSFFILDPADESVALRWVGGATLPQLLRMLDDGRLAVAARHGGAAVSGPDALLARADSLYGAGGDSVAAEVYEQALAEAPPDWSPYARTVESLLFALDHIEAREREVKLALEALPRLRRTPSIANVASYGLAGALALTDSSARRTEWIATFEAAVRAALADSTVSISADDRSGLYIALLDAREAAKDSVGAHRVAAEWAGFLERAAARAKTPDQRVVYDSHRLSAYIELGQPQRAIPMLRQSERDFPDDYNPPARLALAYKAMKKWDEALAVSDRAVAKAYGPRKLTILQARADIFVGRGDLSAARGTLEEAITEALAMPEGQKSEGTIRSLRKKLEGLKPN